VLGVGRGAGRHRQVWRQPRQRHTLSPACRIGCCTWYQLN
jgi:hypothetical protein